MIKYIQFLILISLLLFRLYSILSSPATISGDAHGYVYRAEYINDTLRLPPVGVQPIGFSIFLAPLIGFFGSQLPKFILILHLFLDLAIMAMLAHYCRTLFPGPERRNLRFCMYALLIFQPFTATLANAVYTEQSAAFLMFYAVWLLGKFMSDGKWSHWLLYPATVLLGLVSLLRMEMAILSLLLIGWSVTTKYHDRMSVKKTVIESVASGTVFAVIVGCVLFWQFASTGELALGKKQFHMDGYMSWMRTWFAFEKTEHNKLAFSIATPTWGGWDISAYPPRAFDSMNEFNRVIKLLLQMKNEGYSNAIDAEFKKLAEERVRNNPIRHFVLIPLARILHYWINMDGSQTYLKSIVLPKYIRWPFMGMIMLIKAVILVFAGIGSYGIWRKPDIFPVDTAVVSFGRLAFLAVSIRTIMLGILGTFIWAGLMETRYILVAYPLMIFLCLLGIHYYANGLSAYWKTA
jgi:hypothetical protein